jgi:hypothetical protein
MTNESQNRTIHESDREVETPFQAQYDPGNAESTLSALVCAVATASGRDPLDLPSLHRSVDPDALAMLLSSPSVRNLTFDYAGRTVTVSGQGRVVVS